MSKIKYERGKTMVYPGHYPRLLVTPVFAHEGDFMWVEKIVCVYDANLDDIEEPEFEFHRDTAHYEKNDALRAENDKLRKLVEDFDKCLTEAVRLAYIQGHATIYDGTLLDSLHPRMRELGIEVD